MSSKLDRKEAIRQFKERKVLRGTYAIRCTATGEVWAGASRNLEATRNSAWFALRIGKYLDSSLQQAWSLHGEDAFAYEILETLDDDLLPMAVPGLLKEKRAHWLAQLGARPI